MVRRSCPFQSQKRRLFWVRVYFLFYALTIHYTNEEVKYKPIVSMELQIYQRARPLHPNVVGWHIQSRLWICLLQRWEMEQEIICLQLWSRWKYHNYRNVQKRCSLLRVSGRNLLLPTVSWPLHIRSSHASFLRY